MLESDWKRWGRYLELTLVDTCPVILVILIMTSLRTVIVMQAVAKINGDRKRTSIEARILQHDGFDQQSLVHISTVQLIH